MPPSRMLDKARALTPNQSAKELKSDEITDPLDEAVNYLLVLSARDIHACYYRMAFCSAAPKSLSKTNQQQPIS